MILIAFIVFRSINKIIFAWIHYAKQSTMHKRKSLARSNATVAPQSLVVPTFVQLDDDLPDDCGSDGFDYPDEETLSEDKDLDDAVEKRLDEFFEELTILVVEEIKKQVAAVVQEIVPIIAKQETEKIVAGWLNATRTCDLCGKF